MSQAMDEGALEFRSSPVVKGCWRSLAIVKRIGNRGWVVTQSRS